jgi:hypothetical protein
MGKKFKQHSTTCVSLPPSELSTSYEKSQKCVTGHITWFNCNLTSSTLKFTVLVNTKHIISATNQLWQKIQYFYNLILALRIYLQSTQKMYKLHFKNILHKCCDNYASTEVKSLWQWQQTLPPTNSTKSYCITQHMAAWNHRASHRCRMPLYCTSVALTQTVSSFSGLGVARCL